MDTIKELTSNLTPKTFVESMIRVGVIGYLAVFCFRVASPFINVLVWGVMLAVMLYPLHQKLARKLRGKQGMASTLMILVFCLVTTPPLLILGGALVTDVKEFKTSYESGELVVAQPDASVKDWPVIGERTYTAWSEAAQNLPDFLHSHAAQVEKLGRAVFGMAGDMLGTLVLFFAAFVIGGIMMAYADKGTRAIGRILASLAGASAGPQIQSLIVGTIRSVASGVLGVAFIQALLFGVGFVLAGVPAAPLMAIIVMFIGIIQLPAAIVAIPVIIWVWVSGDGSVGANIFFSVYFLIAGLSDNVLKPLLLGRGVEAPMPVILIGAIGGMITGGLIGLFIGAVVLAVGYKLFMKWTDLADPAAQAGDSG